MNGVGAPAQSKRPPEKGSFPLDHYGECKPKMKVRLFVCLPCSSFKRHGSSTD